MAQARATASWSSVLLVVAATAVEAQDAPAVETKVRALIVDEGGNPRSGVRLAQRTDWRIDANGPRATAGELSKADGSAKLRISRRLNQTSIVAAYADDLSRAGFAVIAAGSDVAATVRTGPVAVVRGVLHQGRAFDGPLTVYRPQLSETEPILSAATDGGAFRLDLPPGVYRVATTARNAAGETAAFEFEVRKGDRRLALGKVDLGAPRAAGLIGKPAPAWRFRAATGLVDGGNVEQFRGRWTFIGFLTDPSSATKKSWGDDLASFRSRFERRADAFGLLLVVDAPAGASLEVTTAAFRAALGSGASDAPLPFALAMDDARFTSTAYEAAPGYDLFLIDPDGNLAEGGTYRLSHEVSKSDPAAVAAADASAAAQDLDALRRQLERVDALSVDAACAALALALPRARCGHTRIAQALAAYAVAPKASGRRAETDVVRLALRAARDAPSASSEVRAAVAAGYAVLGARSDVARLFAQSLDDGDAAVRTAADAAVRAVLKTDLDGLPGPGYKGPVAFSGFLEHLAYDAASAVAVLLRSRELAGAGAKPSDLQTAVRFVVTAGDERTLRAAADAFAAHADPTVRGALTEALGARGDPAVRDALNKLAKDRDAPVKRKAAEALRALEAVRTAAVAVAYRKAP